MGRYFVPFPSTIEIRIFDRIVGCGNDNKAVVVCKDPDMAHRIVALLNADDERQKELSRLAKRAGEMLAEQREKYL